MQLRKIFICLFFSIYTLHDDRNAVGFWNNLFTRFLLLFTLIDFSNDEKSHKQRKTIVIYFSCNQ